MIQPPIFNQAQVSKWLSDIGMAHYDHLFSFHQLNGHVLYELTCADLKQIGIEKIADRKKIVLKISELAAGLYTKDENAAFLMAHQQSLSDIFINLTGDFENVKIDCDAKQEEIFKLKKAIQTKKFEFEMNKRREMEIMFKHLEMRERREQEKHMLMAHKAELADVTEKYQLEMKMLTIRARELKHELESMS